MISVFSNDYTSMTEFLPVGRRYKVSRIYRFVGSDRGERISQVEKQNRGEEWSSTKVMEESSRDVVYFERVWPEAIFSIFG